MRKAFGVKNNEGAYNVVVQDDDGEAFVYDYDVDEPSEVVYIMRRNQWVPVENPEIKSEYLESKPEEWHQEMYPERSQSMANEVQLDQETMANMFDFQGVWLEYYEQLKGTNEL